MDKAILISANPLLPYRYGPTIGSILDHAAHIEKRGKVFWDLVPPGGGKYIHDFTHGDIRTGYFYNVPEKFVTHAFDIEDIALLSLFRRSILKKFSIPARYEYIKKGRTSYYGVLINGIYKLRRKHKLGDFKKVSDGKKVKRNQNYCIVWDTKYEHHDKKVTRQEIMNDYIADLLLRGRVTEKDIQNLFYYQLMQNQTLKEKEGYFKGGRLDLLFQNRLGEYRVYELKKGVAPVSTLKQIKRYMKACIKKYKIPHNRIKGVILCKDAEPKLWDAVKKEKNIEIKRYYFEVNIK